MKVLEYLTTHTLEQLCNEFSIKVSHNELYPELYVLNYDQIDSPKTHQITLECRSLVLGSTDQGKTFFVVSRAFDRFFNYGENDYNPNIGMLTCYEKLDGSLVSVFNYNDQWLYRTKSIIMPTTTINGYDRTWKDLIESSLNWDKGFVADKAHTYIFEVVSRENRVVVKYEEDAAYLLAIRSNEFGFYSKIVTHKFSSPRRYTFKTTEECMDAVKNLPNLEEGYVAYNYDGVPVCKIKSPSYLVAHRIKGEGLTPKRIRELVVINEQDEYLAVFPEDEKYFTDYINVWDDLQWRLKSIERIYFNITDAKEYAMFVKDFPFSAVLFQAKKSGKCVTKVLTEQKTSYKVKLLEIMMEETNNE